MKGSHDVALEADETCADIALAETDAPIQTDTRRRSAKSKRTRLARYRMRCPRCALGLVEIIPGPVSREKCTTCSYTWYDPAELLKIAKNDRTGFFQTLD